VPWSAAAATCLTLCLHSALCSEAREFLHMLVNSKYCCRRALAALPDDAALSVLDQCTKARLRATRNRSAWLTSQCRRLERSAAASAS